MLSTDILTLQAIEAVRMHYDPDDDFESDIQRLFLCPTKVIWNDTTFSIHILQHESKKS